MRFLLGLFTTVLMATCAMAAVVKDVRVRTLDGMGGDTSDVLAACVVHPGSEVSQDSCSLDVRALTDSGRYDYVGVEMTREVDGVVVTYVVRRRYRFQGPLVVKGADYFSESKIAKLAGLKNGDYVSESILAGCAEKIHDEYIKKYFPYVAISADIQPIADSAGAATVTFVIEEGKREKVHAFVFEGNRSIASKDLLEKDTAARSTLKDDVSDSDQLGLSVGELRRSIGHYPWWNPIGWFMDEPASEQQMEDARLTVQNIYRDRGYLDAKVTGPERRPRPDGTVDMVYTVDEGVRYTVSDLKVMGVALFPADSVLGSVRLLPGDIAGQAAIDEAVKDIELYYGGRGYMDTQVRIIKEPNATDPSKISLVFQVAEGKLVYIGNLLIRGNDKTKDKVIRREISVSPGQVMNEAKITHSEVRLYNLGYFQPREMGGVRHYTETTGEKAADGHEIRDLVYEVKEQGTGNFMFGVGASSVDSIYGFAEITQSNFDIMNWRTFTGGGQKARIGAQIGSRIQTVEASITEPWFMDRPISLTVEGYRRMRWYDQYDEIRTGGSIGVAYPMQLFGRRFGRFGARYTLEMVSMEDVDSGVWTDTPNAAGATRFFQDQEDRYSDNLNSIIRIFWADDKRNNPFIPTTGYRTTVFAELAEGGIGDNEFWKLGANYQQWITVIPAWRHVLSFKGRIETIDSTNDDLPVYENLFLGGPRNVRGVEYREIGPKLFNGGEHVPRGGRTLIAGTVEYTIPVVKAVRFATFMDAGSVDADAGSISSDFVVSVGCGIRIDIPNFPIRLDFSKMIKEDDDYTEDEFFSFSINFE